MSEPLSRTTTMITKDVTSPRNTMFLPKTVSETKVFLPLIKSFKATTKQRHDKIQVVLDVVWKFQKNGITFLIGNLASGDQSLSSTTMKQNVKHRWQRNPQQTKRSQRVFQLQHKSTALLT